MIKLSEITLEANKKALLSKSDEDLQAFPVSYLRKLLRGIGINTLNRGDEDILVSVAKKDELLASLKRSIEKTKKIEVIETEYANILPYVSSEDLNNYVEIAAEIDARDRKHLGELSTQAYKDFRDLSQKLYYTFSIEEADKVKIQFAGIASSIVEALDSRVVTKARYSSEENSEKIYESQGLADFTKLDYRGTVIQNLRDMIKEEPEGWLKKQLYIDLEKVLAQYIFQLTRKYSNTKKERDDSYVDTVSTNIRQVDVSMLLDWSYRVLSELNDKTASSEWKEVSIALVFTCGRRQVEIHSTGSMVAIAGKSHALMFTGQAKAKGKAATYYAANPSYEIPTLIPAHLIVNAFEWLGKKNKRLEDTRKVNQNLNPELAPLVKKLAMENLSFYGFDSDAEAYVKIGEPNLVGKYVNLDNIAFNEIRFSYHSLRELYNLCAFEAFGKNRGMKSTKYGASILGHDRVLEKSYTSQTSARYEDEFTLYPGSKVKID